MKRGLVISGGGAKGAWGGGVAQALSEMGNDWNYFYGTSTGSLLIPLISIKDFEKLKKAYTSVTNKDIFSVDPFTKNGKINILNAIFRIIKGKTSLGEGKNLRKKIEEFLDKETYEKIKKLNKKLVVCAVDYKTGNKIFVSNLNTEYEKFLDYIYASTSVPIAFDFVKIDNMLLLDGGVKEHVPIQSAINDGCTEIDVIALRPSVYPSSNWDGNNIIDVFFRTIDLMLEEISDDDILIGKLYSEKTVKINFYFTPRILTDNSLIFDKKQMNDWWNEAYELTKNKNITKKTFLLRKNKILDKEL